MRTWDGVFILKFIYTYWQMFNIKKDIEIHPLNLN